MARVKTRFFIGPGGLLFFGAAILTLMAAIYTQANLLFWSFGLLLGALLTSVVMSWAVLRGVSVKRFLPPNAVAGESTAIRYQVTNHRRFLPAFSLVLSERWEPRRRWFGAAVPDPQNPLAGDVPRLRGTPSGWVLHVGPQQTAQAEAICWPMRRGKLRFRAIEVQTSFPFGMLGRSILFPDEEELTVYPHLFRINRQSMRTLSASESSSAKRQPKPGLSEEFFGLREYRPGDRLRAIDWKRTAHTGRLVSRETSRPGVTRVMVLLDLTKPGPEAAIPLSPPPRPPAGVDFLGRRREPPPEPVPDPRHPWVDAERAISLAASFVVGAHFQGFPVGLAIKGVDCPVFRVHHSLPHRSMMLDALANLDLSRRSTRADWTPHPTLIIRPAAAGPPTATFGTHGELILSAAELEQFVVEIEGGASAMLITSAAIKRRSDRAEAVAWK